MPRNQAGLMSSPPNRGGLMTTAVHPEAATSKPVDVENAEARLLGDADATKVDAGTAASG